MSGGRGSTIRLFHRDFGPKVLGVGVGETGRIRGRWPRRLWPGELEAACDATEQLGFAAGAGERDADRCRRLDDAPSDLEQAQPQGGELGDGERLRLGDGIAPVSMSQ